MTLVAGVDCSTQACKIVIRDVQSGRLVRHGRAPHPPGTEVHPSVWWSAFQQAAADAGGLGDVAAVSIAAQQHGLICLDEDGVVIRPALLWNDTRSAAAAQELTGEIDPAVWATAVGVVPVASFTIAKLRWLAEQEPANAARVAAVCLPHDWLTWRLSGSTTIRDLVTDRSDASGTGYFDPRSGNYRRDLLMLAFGRDVLLPRVVAASEAITSPGSEFYPAGLLGPGAADNAAAAFGLGLDERALVSLGTSGTVCGISTQLPNDPSGIVAGFADLGSQFLALTCTLNAARVLEVAARLIGTDLAGLSDRALRAVPGAAGLSMVAYLEGERTPNLPEATGSIHGMTVVNATPDNLARAAIEGMLCGQAVGLDAIAAQGGSVSGVYLIGGAARSPAVRAIAPTVFGVPVFVPPPGEHAADGAARQAGWVLSGAAEPPVAAAATEPPERYEAAETSGLRERYRAAAPLHLDRPRAISPNLSTGGQ